VAACEASPGAAPPQPRTHVYLLRGLLTIFSLGMDTLAEELKGHDTNHRFVCCDALFRHEHAQHVSETKNRFPRG
jgi:hypothetical protein